ncbi:DCC1-like thiol-disulfide oxidoreductase family protein [Candidatus Poriferisodalis sp.]|uniref:DCC1-like thiol-disulfide oxidoreductase family protein n=1 Tax=Candidatus Poriferisodalis sp. TaxID=3101277 RepID=UPI003AF81467
MPIVGIPFRVVRRRQLSQQPRETSQVWLIYDGECPMCNNYAQYLRLKQSVGEFVLVDARQGGPIVDEVRRLPHDLNDGMVVKIGNRHFAGHEALHVLALLSEDRGAFNKFNRLAFSSPLISRVTYPMLKFGRWVLLKLKGVAPIAHER